MVTVPSIRARFTLRAIEAYGHPKVSIPSLCEQVGLDPAVLEDPHARVQLATLDRLYDVAAALASDDAFGLRVGDAADARDYGVLGYTLLCSRSFSDAQARLAPYVALLEGAEQIGLRVEGDIARFIYRVDHSHSRHRSEALLAAFTRFAHAATRSPLSTIEVRFQHPQPADVSEHRRVWGTPLRFGCPANELVFPAAYAERPLVRHEPALSEVLSEHIAHETALLRPSASLVAQVRALAKEGLECGGADARTIAKRLGMSSRTLQRRLRADGTSMRDTMDQLRHELAVQHLQQAACSITQLSVQLGYSSAGAFSEAFQRWTGMTPSGYRRGFSARLQHAS